MDPDGSIDAAAVVSLVQGIVGESWPTSESGRKRLFERVGLKDSGRRVGGPHTVGTELHHPLEVPVAGPVIGTWVLDGGAFTQVYFQLRWDSSPPSPETATCFDEIMRRFTDLYGGPEIPWHGQKSLRRMWDANGLELDVHYGNEARSSLMISISDGLLAQLVQQD